MYGLSGQCNKLRISIYMDIRKHLVQVDNAVHWQGHFLRGKRFAIIGHLSLLYNT